MSKNFMKNGKWIEKPHTTQVLTCACGGKYIKTRPEQKSCLRCAVGVR